MESKNKCWGHYYLSFLEPDRLMGHTNKTNRQNFPSPGQSEPFGAFGPPDEFSQLRFKLPDLRHDIPAFSSIDEDEIRYALEILAQTVTRMAP